MAMKKINKPIVTFMFIASVLLNSTFAVAASTHAPSRGCVDNETEFLRPERLPALLGERFFDVVAPLAHSGYVAVQDRVAGELEKLWQAPSRGPIPMIVTVPVYMGIWCWLIAKYRPTLIAK
jgi:hypothetical protein